MNGIGWDWGDVLDRAPYGANKPDRIGWKSPGRGILRAPGANNNNPLDPIQVSCAIPHLQALSPVHAQLVLSVQLFYPPTGSG